MRVRAITTIGRAVDVRYPTNRAIVAIASVVAVVGAVGRIASGSALVAAIAWGAFAGLTAFVTWVIGRELDPDHDYSAFVGTAFVLAWMMMNGPPELMFSLWIILSMRIVNRTGGRPATWLDSLFTAAVALMLVRRGLWIAGLAMPMVFVADALLQPARRSPFLFAGLALLGALLVSDTRTIAVVAHVGIATWIGLGVAAFLMLVVIGTSREIRAVGDRGGQPLRPGRVRVAQGLALLVGCASLAAHGAEGLAAGLPLWSAMLGVGLYRIAILVSRARTRRR